MIGGQRVIGGVLVAGVPGHLGYYASTDGMIFSFKRREARELAQFPSPDGHKHVYVSDNGIMYKLRVHRAVLAAWSGDTGDGRECRHLDDNPANNRLENLAWGSRADNIADARRNGRIKAGEGKVGHKLTEAQAIEIRALAGSVGYVEIGRRYGISHTTARRIAKGIKWAYLGEV